MNKFSCIPHQWKTSRGGKLEEQSTWPKYSKIVLLYFLSSLFLIFSLHSFNYFLLNWLTILLADIAGLPKPKNLSGYSLMPLVLEKAEDGVPSKELHAPWILSEFHGCNVNASSYMLRTAQWKYIAYADGHSVPPQLFGMLFFFFFLLNFLISNQICISRTE